MWGSRRDDLLGMMNAAVALVLVIPLLIIGLTQRRSTDAPDGPKGSDIELVRSASNDQPPIITITEAQVYSFPSGTAVLTDDLKRYLMDVAIPQVVAIAEQYNCDTIEVIGHTDSQRVRTHSTLDERLMESLYSPTFNVTPGSNADLGLLRAWAVIRLLAADPRLAGRRFAGYSAADTLMPNGRFASGSSRRADESVRRRIEIRARGVTPSAP